MLKIEMHRDDFDDFCKTAWHLIELVEKSASATKSQRSAAAKLRADHDLAVCEYLANTGKHSHARPRAVARSKFSVVEISVGYGVGRYGMGGFGVGEQAIVVKFTDGTERNALEIVQSVTAKWESILV